MRTFFWLLIAILTFSCNYQQKSSVSGESTFPGDTLAYAELLAGFEKRFAEVEKKYESAGEDQEEELVRAYEQVEMELVEAQKEFIKAYPKSSYCIPILWEIDWSFTSAAEFKSCLELIDPSMHPQEDYRRLAALIKQMEKVEVGKTAPDFEINRTEGRPVRLSSVYGKSELLLLDFWASTCAPCRKENANIRKAYDLFQGKGFDVLGVSTDVRKEQWLAAIEQDGLIWTNLCSLEKWNENEVVKSYALRQVSQNFLLDNTGKIIAKDLRGENLLNTLEELLK